MFLLSVAHALPTERNALVGCVNGPVVHEAELAVPTTGGDESVRPLGFRIVVEGDRRLALGSNPLSLERPRSALSALDERALSLQLFLSVGAPR